MDQIALTARQASIAFTATTTGITLATSLILLGIWRKGYDIYDPKTKTRKKLFDNGVKWLLIACLLWSFTSVVQIIKLVPDKDSPSAAAQSTTPSSQQKPSAPEHNKGNPVREFFWVAFSLTNSLCFVLSMANFDEIVEEIVKAKEEDRRPGFAARTLHMIYENRYRIWAFFIVMAAILRAIDFSLGFRHGFCYGFDVFISSLAICWLAWAFFKTFHERDFFFLKWLSGLIFVIFLISQFGNAEFLDFLFASPKQTLFRIAWSVGADGMISLLFVTLAFSWADKRGQEILNMYSPIEPPPTRGVGSGA